MSFLNQPQQDGPYRSENTFVKGLQADASPNATPATSLTAAQNVHLLRQQGSELILASEPGMERSCLLPPGYVVHGWVERGGVLYLLLAEVVDGAATGRGQLGTFPSPDYQYENPADPTSELVTSGELTNNYRPLRVYYGDFNDTQPTDLISVEFNLGLDAPSELELQDSYDGTLNIIVNDRARNPALLINSGFVVRLPMLGVSPANSPGRYEVVLRQGMAQTNRYSRADFTSRLRLHPKGNTLGRARLVDVLEGGKLLGGEYHYYFTYCDADDNETPIFAELGPVFVLASSPVPAASMGMRDGEASTMQVKMLLENLDPTLGFVRVSYARRSGEPEALALAYQLTEKLRVSALGTLSFTHSGYATEAQLSAEQLQHATGSISAFTTMCQAGSRLLLGGTRLDAVNDADLVNFARGTKLGSEQISLPNVPGLEVSSDAGASLYQSFDHLQFQGAGSGLTPYDHSQAAWNGGYLNPLNSTYRLGYMAGEAVPVGMRFVLEDYSVTETYPLRGIDNVNGSYREDNYYADSAADFYSADGWMNVANPNTSAYVQNINGVYRFPLSRASADLPGGLKPLVESGRNALNILALRVEIPAISPALRRRCVGVQFMRAARRANCVAQGYAVPTVRALEVSPGGGQEPYDHYNGALHAIYRGTTTSNLKVLPAVRGVLEAVQGPDEDKGVFPFQFNRRITVDGVGTANILDTKRVAFYAPDALLRPSKLLPLLNEQTLAASPVATAYAKAAVAYQNPSGAGNAVGGSWSLWKSVAQQGEGNSLATFYPGKGYWTLDNQRAVNRGKFGSQEGYLNGKSNVKDELYQFNISYDPYVGLEFTSDVDGSDQLTGGSSSIQSGIPRNANVPGVLASPAVAVAKVFNLYPGTGIRTTDQLRQVYPLESLDYFPISERLSWNELESQLDADRRLLLFGGDTYVGVTYRRVFRAMPKDQRGKDEWNAPIGQILSMVCETSVNPYARSEDVTSANASSGASYLPRLGYDARDFNAYRGSEYFMQAETTRYNAGYNTANEDSPLLVLSPARLPDIPFRAQRFEVRVWASAVAVDGSFSNGYRFLPPLSFKDYERSLGKIVRLLPVASNQVLVVHEHGLELLGLNDQTLTGENKAGPVYAEALNFLPPQGRIISRKLGCQHAFGVCVTPKGVYGVDATSLCAWFWPTGGGEDSVKRISDFSVSSLLGPVLKAYQRQAVSLLDLDIRVVYDSARADVVFSLYQRTAAGIDQPPYAGAMTLVYNEDLQEFISQASYRAQMLLPVPDRGLYSLPLPGQARTPAGGYSLWLHRQRSDQATRYYDFTHGAYAEFIVTGTSAEVQKELQHVLLVTDGPDPDSLQVSTPSQGVFTQALVGAAGTSIVQRNLRRKSDTTYLTVQAPSVLPWGGRARGKWLRLRLALTKGYADVLAQLPGQVQTRLLKAQTTVRDVFD